MAASIGRLNNFRPFFVCSQKLIGVRNGSRFIILKPHLGLSHCDCSFPRPYTSLSQSKEEFSFPLKLETSQSNAISDNLLDGYYPEDGPTFSSFDEMVNFRLQQASCSVVVQVNSMKSAISVERHCRCFGNVKRMFHYQLPDKELILVEYENEFDVRNLLQNCSHGTNTDIIPAVSPFMWIRGTPNQTTHTPSSINILTNSNNNENLNEVLLSAKSISEQIGLLHKHVRLSEIGHRLRWIMCMQIQQIFSGIFPYMRVYPFGSSVNGCGRNTSDLDMVVSLSDRNETQKDKSPFVFQCKAALSNNRLQTQRHMESLADILQHFTPGCIQVQRILQARVPIIKYYHEFTGLDCDLSLGSLSGVYMSELLYLFGEMDWRFRPLVSVVRYWGGLCRLTSPIPGRTVTNFTLTLLVVYYLQKRSTPILPTVNEMIRLARPQDRRSTEDLDCTFLRDSSVFSQRSKLNNETLGELFIGFLHFLESFDFNQRAISIIWGEASLKPESNPLYIQNPLERELNVSKNVSFEEVTRLSLEARNALYNLETGESNQWGLLSLSPALKNTGPQSSNDESNRRKQSLTASLEIKNLFQPDSIDKSKPSECTDLQGKSTNVQFITEPTSTNTSKQLPLNGFIKQMQSSVSVKSTQETKVSVSYKMTTKKNKDSSQKKKDVAWKYW